MTSIHSMSSRVRTQLLGAIGLTVIVTISALLIATYQRAFVDVVEVTVHTDRAGLLLDKGARVRMSGVSVGEVRGTRLSEDGTVVVSVALDADTADLVPADVRASIRATTVFGAKFVDLRTPPGAGADAERTPIADGAVLSADRVSVEVNDVFQHGISVLQAVDPARVNATLSAAATALDGRGRQLGEALTGWREYLDALEPHLGALESDLATADDVLRIYADVAPALLASGDHLATTSRTLVTQQDDLHALLTGTVETAGSASRLLTALDQPLRRFNREWVPVSTLLDEYSPVVGCLIDSIHNHIGIFDGFFGGFQREQNFYYIKTGFLPGQDPYTLAKNRPKLVTGVGPVCYPEATAEHPSLPHIDFDDGTAGTYSERSTGKPVDVSNPVAVYADLIDDWFGSEVTAQLLAQREEGGR